MRRICYFLTLLLSPFLSYSQFTEAPYSYLEESQKWPQVPQSPEVAAFEKYGNLPVNSYAGTAQISIPLYVIQGMESSVPISLTYDASGIKADQLSTNVGLGWNLNFGGVVSRQILALPDEEYAGTYTKIWDSDVQDMWDDVFDGTVTWLNGTWSSAAPRNRAKNFYFDYVDNTIDYQADLFSFNVNGISGTFVTDYQNPIVADNTYQVYCIDNPDIKVYRDTNGGSVTGWRVVDTGGMTYVFEQPEWTRQEVSEPDDGSGTELEYNRKYVNAWYLTKMISPSGLDVFEFDYNSGVEWADDVDYKRQSEVKTSKHIYAGLCNVGGIDLGRHQTVGYNRQFTQQPYLESISLNGVELFTVSVGSRDDLTSSTNRYTGFTAKDDNGNTVLQVDLDNDQYFTRQLLETPDQDNSRLKLDGVSIYRDNALDAKKYTFEYETDTVPVRVTNNVDFWGYFNGPSTTTGNLIPVNNDDFQPMLPGTTFTGVGRDPDIDDAKMGTLKSITYPTGGKTTFYYESHQGFDDTQPGYDLKAVDDTVGGLRLQKQVSDPNDGGPSITTYYYYNDIKDATSGVGTQVYSELTGGSYETSGILQQNLAFFEEKDVEHPEDECDNLITKRYFQYATNRAPQAPQKVTYTTVSEITLEGTTFKGCTVTEFYNQVYDGVDLMVHNRPFYNTTLTNGEVKYRKVYDSNFNLLQEIQNEYSNTEIIDSTYSEFMGFHLIAEINPDPGTERSGSNGCFLVVDSPDPPATPDTFGFHINQQWGPHGCNGGGDMPSYFRVDPNKYGFSQWWKRLDWSISKTYSGASALVDTTYYSYHTNSVPTHYLPISIKKNDSKGLENKIELTYPLDEYQTGSSVIDIMVDRNQIGGHLQVKKYYDNTLSSTQRKIYKVTGQITPTQGLGTYDIVRPDTINVSKGPLSLEPRFIYHSYDSYGNPQEISQPNGTKTYYIWGYHGKLLIAEIKNKGGTIPSGVQTLINTAVTASDNDDDTHGTNEQALLTALGALRSDSYFDDTQVTTFTYDPGIGVNTITDPRGYTMYYHYDQHNRLEKVVDADDNIVGKNQYNYRVN